MSQRHDRELPGIIVGIQRLLLSVVIDYLAKVSLLVKKPYSDNGNAQIARRFQLIARDSPSATGIYRERFAQHEFHAEVSRTP